MTSTLALLASLASGPAQASPFQAENFSLGLPVRADLVGLAFGVQPELLWRPIKAEGMFHVRASVGGVLGPELALVPMSLGVREVFLPTRAFRPGLGAGLQFQSFFPYGHCPVPRLDQYIEFTLDYRIRDGLRATAQLSPEFGWIGGFGLGMAARAGVQLDFPLKR